MDNYEDIINLPHPDPKHHPRMSLYERSGQFAPFAALTGYEESVIETGRLTSKKHELTEEEKLHINDTLIEIDESEIKPKVKVIYFVNDAKKSGGSYKEYEGTVKKIDKYKRLLFIDSLRILIDNIFSLEIKRDSYDDE